VGSLVVSSLRNGVDNELLAVFRDDMLNVRYVHAREYYSAERGYEEHEFDDNEVFDIIEFRAPGQHIAARLDVMGITPAVVIEYLENQFHDRNGILYNENFLVGLTEDVKEAIKRERSFLMSLTAQDWIARLASIREDRSESYDQVIGGRKWLLGQLDYWDARFALRAVLLSFPDSEVCLDISDLEDAGWSSEAQRGSLVSDAAAVISGMAGMHAPVVVLTEGRTDAEFLSASLKILYPYLTDLIRFLDYDQKTEGGAGALVRMVRAFAAAGIVNRVIAVFDNDTAAADALRVLDLSKLPSQLQVLQYPTIEIASAYPTLGPPSQISPNGSASVADVNGLAGSIEIYLGRDVLAGSDGRLLPVQWKSYIASAGRYQGEVVDKASIHESFRAKYRLALDHPETIANQDWEGLRLIIDAIRRAAQLAFGGVDPTAGLARS